MTSQTAQYPSYKECKTLLLGQWSAATRGEMSHQYSSKLDSRETTRSVLNPATSVSCTTRTSANISLTYSNNEPVECCAQPRTKTCMFRYLAADTVTELARYLLRDCVILYHFQMKKTCCLATFKRLLKTHLFRAIYAM